MKSQKKVIEKTLLALAGEANPLVSALAAALADAVGRAGHAYPASPSDPDFREIGALLSVLVENVLDEGQSPTLIVEALLEIDSALMAQARIEQPLASLFVPIATERALQAAAERRADQVSQSLAERSPILKVDKRALVAAPVGSLTDESLARFIDRLLSRVGRDKPKKVHLSIRGLERPPGTEKQLDLLKEELNSLKIDLEIHS